MEIFLSLRFPINPNVQLCEMDQLQNRYPQFLSWLKGLSLDFPYNDINLMLNDKSIIKNTLLHRHLFRLKFNFMCEQLENEFKQNRDYDLDKDIARVLSLYKGVYR